MHGRHADAIKAARADLKRAGGGELAIKGRDGAVRKQDTVLRATTRAGRQASSPVGDAAEGPSGTTRAPD